MAVSDFSHHSKIHLSSLLAEHLCLLSILGQATLYLKSQLILNQSSAVDSRTPILKGRGGKTTKAQRVQTDHNFLQIVAESRP